MITSTAAKDTIRQILTENYVCLHDILSLNPLGFAGSLYSCQFFGDSTLDYVSTAVGVSHQTKAHRLLQDSKQAILTYQHPQERLRELLDIFSNAQPAARPVVNRILEKVHYHFVTITA